jgi:hypothetical protein
LVLAGKAFIFECLFCFGTSQIIGTAKNIFTFFHKIFATINIYSTFVRSNRHNNANNNHLTTTQMVTKQQLIDAATAKGAEVIIEKDEYTAKELIGIRLKKNTCTTGLKCNLGKLTYHSITAIPKTQA